MGSARIGKRPFQFGPEGFEIHHPAVGLELVAEVAQPPQSIVEIEETQPASHSNPHPPSTGEWNHSQADLAR
jgi:hypothetical protein